MLPPNCNGTRAFSARRAEHFRFRPVRIPQCRLTDGRTAAQGPAEGLVPSSHGTGDAAPPVIKRMAAADTPEREHAALEGAVLLNRLQRILGTGGNIPAARRPVRGDGHPVKFHQGQQDLFHHDRSSSSSSFLQRRRKVSFSSFQEAVRVRPLATRIISYPWRSRPELSR